MEDPTKLSLDTVIKRVIDRDNRTTAEVQANTIASSSKAPKSSAKEEKKKGKKKDGVTAVMDWGNLIEDRFKSDVRMEEQIASHLSW